MKEYIKGLFLRFAKYIFNKQDVKYVILSQSIIQLVPVVKEVVENTSNMEGLLSNEYRHSHTYATLIKRIPEAKGREVGLCIEMVINGLL
jgi:hypothetical protein